MDYIKTMNTDADIDDEEVWDIDRKKAFEAPQRTELIANYILDHFDQNTCRGDKNAGGIVLMQSFKDYYYGYETADGKPMPGYVDMIEDLTGRFPVRSRGPLGNRTRRILSGCSVPS